MFFVSPGIAGKSGIKVAYVKVDDYPDLSKVKPYPSLKKNTLITVSPSLIPALAGTMKIPLPLFSVK